MNTIVLILGLILLATSVFVLARTLLFTPGRSELRLEEIRAYGFRSQDAVDAESGPSLGDLAGRVGGRLRGSRFTMSEEQMRGMLVQAGMYGTSADRLLGSQVLGAVVGGLLLLWLTSLGGFSIVLIILFTAAGVVLGFMAPIVYVKRRIRLRHDEIEYELPDLIDLLVVSLEAGLSFPASMRVASDRLTGALGQELRLTLQEQNMGLSIEDALGNLQKRADTGGMAIFTRSVIQGQALGISMGQIMRNVAEEMRKRRKSRAEERAHKAPVKLLFPLVFLIFPSLFVVILLPAIINIADTLG
jgi:tight adherence protein C